MADRGPHLAGEIVSSLSLGRLAAALRMGGLAAELRESSHYEGGRYIRVTEDGDFTVEQVASGDFLIRAAADSDQQLLDTASSASKALAVQGIRHRFELYDGESMMVQYLHHLWPQGLSA